MSPAIVQLSHDQSGDIQSLLQAFHLPCEDCQQHIDNFVGIFDQKRLVAVGSLEIFDTTGLLRSVVVHLDCRGRGLAGLIVSYLHERARSNSLQSLCLLTETAESYFARLGYQKVDRDRLPDEIKSTRQFKTLCPASAQAMQFYL